MFIGGNLEEVMWLDASTGSNQVAAGMMFSTMQRCQWNIVLLWGEMLYSKETMSLADLSLLGSYPVVFFPLIHSPSL